MAIIRLIFVVAALLWTQTAPAAGAEMKFSAHNSGNCCAWIGAEGEITENTPKSFEIFISEYKREFKTNRYPNTVYLSSNGGSLIAAMELGRKFRAYEITTSVGISKKSQEFGDSSISGANCLSACVFLFAGGKYRYYQSKTPFHSFSPLDLPHLGVHQAFFRNEKIIVEEEKTQQVASRLGVQAGQLLSALQIAYLIEMNVSPALVALSAATRPENIRVLSEGEAIGLSLAMHYERQPEWDLKLVGAGIALRGYGIVGSASFEVGMWCADQRTGQMVMSVRLMMSPHDPTPAERATRLQHYKYGLQFRDLSLNVNVPVVNYEGDQKEIKFNVLLTEKAMQLISAGAKFRFAADAPRVDDVSPYLYFGVSAQHIGLLRRACLA